MEKAGIIVQIVSPWANCIMVTPKWTQPREPPRKRLYVGYQALNKLLPLVTKAHSKSKGVLTLVPLPKIDEMYAKLAGSSIYSILDLRSGYYHIALAQAPTYFQCLINEVLSSLDFAFGYLDDILIYSPNSETLKDILK